MARAGLKILVAIDGSRSADAAVETVLRFPWPEGSCVNGVVALRSGYFGVRTKKVDKAVRRSLQDTATAARDILASRWNDAKVAVLNKAPLDAILGEAKRLRADVIALGWRGHGTFRRLLAGSVSRAVAARAGCSILVARAVPDTVRRFVIGYDDSVNARRAVRLLSRLEPGQGMHAVLVNVIDKVTLPARASRLPAAVRAVVRSNLTALNAKRHKRAKTAVNAAAARLRRAGWTTKTDIRTGSPLVGLSSALKAHRGDVLVVGARETGGLERALLGSVAQGALNQSPTPVLIVR